MLIKDEKLIKDPKTGRIFPDMKSAREFYCPLKNKKDAECVCPTCQISFRNSGWPISCRDLCDLVPMYAARRMGYIIVSEEGDNMGKLKKQSNLAKLLGVLDDEEFRWKDGRTYRIHNGRRQWKVSPGQALR